MKQRDSALLSMGVGLIMGAGLGYLASLLVSDPDRKKHKKVVGEKFEQIQEVLSQQDVTRRVKDIFKEATDEAMEKYRRVSDEFAVNLSGIKSSLGLVDEREYRRAISRLITTLKKDGEFDTVQLRKIKKYLESDFKLIKKIKKA